MSVNDQCYGYGDAIVAAFQTSRPQVNDIVGIYRADDVDHGVMEFPVMWMWTCGTFYNFKIVPEKNIRDRTESIPPKAERHAGSDPGTFLLLP